MPDRPSRPGRRVTMAQVAARAGVSTMTASYVFNDPGRVSQRARERVLSAAGELGYVGPDPSARALRRGRTGVVGVVLGEHLTYAFEDPQAAAFLAGIAEVCAAAGDGLMILPLTESTEDVGRIRAAAVDGFVVWTTADDSPVPRAAVATGLPVVVHGGPAVEGALVVGIDDRAAARAVGRLVFAGAERPAVISFPLTADRQRLVATGVDPRHASFPVTRARLLGFRDALQELGMDWSAVPVAACATNSAEESRAATDRLLADRQVDAIATMSDELAIGVLASLDRLALSVPTDVAVSGWDDSPAARVSDLTTVAQSLRAQGAACARSILTGESSDDFSQTWEVKQRSTTRTSNPE